MKNHCVSLEIAKQLKDVGWKKETEFWWVRIGIDFYELRYMALGSREQLELEKKYPGSITAPLATEILEELPCHVDISNYSYTLYLLKHIKGYKMWYSDYAGRQWGNAFTDKFLSNALALMWLYLKKENLI